MKHVTWKIAYLVSVIVFIFVEHRIFSKRWKRHEGARRTMGVATVLGLAFPLVIAGIFDLITYAWTWLAFGVAGALTAAMYINEKAIAAETKRRAFNGATRAGKKEKDWKQ